jgi:porin
MIDVVAAPVPPPAVIHVAAPTRAPLIEKPNGGPADTVPLVPLPPFPQNGPSPAGTATGNRTPPAHLLGDWGGIRTSMERLGVTPSIQYIGMPAGNVSGGTARRATYVAQMTAGLTFDLDRLAGIKGGVFQALVTNRHGHNLNDVSGLHTLQAPQAVWGAGMVWRLSQFWYRQTIGNAEIKAGRMSVGEDFGTAPCFFESLYFCGIVPGHMAFNYWYNPPVSVWGTRVRIGDRLGYTAVGAYEQNQSNVQADKGFNLSFRGTTGAIIPIERAFVTRIGGDAGRAGIYKLGVWYDTSRSHDLVTDIDGGYAALSGLPLRSQRGRWGAYVVGRQQLTPADGDGRGAININFSAVLADPRTNVIRTILVAGVTYSGLLAFRPKDEIGLAIGRTSVNKRLRAREDMQLALGLTSLRPQTSELAIETTYSVNITPALNLRPNMQFYVRPNGRSNRATATILGVGIFMSL